MLFKVVYGGKKKLVKIDGADYNSLMTEVKKKCSIHEKDLILQDDTGVEVDEDVFTDLLQERSHNILWRIVDQDSECPVLDSSCSSQTDTLSLSSETDDSAGPSSKRPRFDETFEAKQFVNRIMEEKAGGPAILAEYKEHGKLKDSTRRHLVNIVVAYITDKEGRVPSKETKICCALGIVTLFPSLKDPYSTTGYVLQDFNIKFGTETASRLLEQWDGLKPKVISEAKTLTSNLHLNSLLAAAQGWDSDMSSILLLAYFLPPSAGGRNKSTKISIQEAMDYIVQFHKSCRSLTEHIEKTEGLQPHLLAVGSAKNNIHNFYIVLDGQLIPCQAKSSLAAFDELFVFSVSYPHCLNAMYTFIQTTVYKIDIGTVRETPRVKDLRSKLLN
ncbi:uncharacterized protein LOC127655686 [Xyrauchen texanus]|uniref:uncharacterized protein LOC127655686 n=1 Tax=Xyrauchen texanus TaxID=154827 RepID=UPI00224198BA|nr:uncharacterized protein LOC127655686 [Xyrauchen texanus]